jgi:pSer/pThr/pTyr-binding forkhead associated (FHA) protein
VAIGCIVGNVPRYFYLTPVLGEGSATKYPVTEEPQIVGRSSRAGIYLIEPSVSRRHARIEVRHDEVLLEDLASKHGTFVNSRRIRSAQLKSGDLVVFGLAVVLRLEETDQPVEPPPRAEPQDPPALLEEPSLTINRQELLRKAPLGPSIEGASEDMVPLADYALKLTRLGGLCLALLPGLYARLTQLADMMAEEEGTVDVETVRVGLEPLLTTVTQLMEVAAKVAPEPVEPVSLADVVRRAVARVSEENKRRSIFVVTRVAEELLVRADPDRLAAVIAGLMINAGNHSQEGASIEVVVKPARQGVLLQVIDEGYGYPDEILSQAFHPLGAELADPAAIRLWEARREIVALGGTLQVRSNEGVGATVRIELPLVESEG